MRNRHLFLSACSLILLSQTIYANTQIDCQFRLGLGDNIGFSVIDIEPEFPIDNQPFTLIAETGFSCPNEAIETNNVVVSVSNQDIAITAYYPPRNPAFTCVPVTAHYRCTLSFQGLDTGQYNILFRRSELPGSPEPIRPDVILATRQMTILGNHPIPTLSSSLLWLHSMTLVVLVTMFNRKITPNLSKYRFR